MYVGTLLMYKLYSGTTTCECVGRMNHSFALDRVLLIWTPVDNKLEQRKWEDLRKREKAIDMESEQTLSKVPSWAAMGKWLYKQEKKQK